MNIYKKVWKHIYDLIYYKHDQKLIERYAGIECGDPTYIGDDIVMILRRDNKTAGFFSDYLIFLGAIEFAVNRGYIPVIDRLHYPVVLLQDQKQQNNENAWEYYFEQPCNMGLNDIGGRLIIKGPERSEGNIFHGLRLQHCFKNNKELKAYWKNIAKKYIRFNKKTQEILDEEYKNLFLSEDKRVLGVSVREGYSVAIKKGIKSLFAKQPSMEMLIKDVKKILKEDEGIKSIFVACEYEETLDLFLNTFTNYEVLYVQKDRYREKDDYPCNPDQVNMQYNQKNRKQIAINYIKEVYLISKCDSYVYSLASGSVAANLMKEGEYTHEVCYEQGIIL